MKPLRYLLALLCAALIQVSPAFAQDLPASASRAPMIAGKYAVEGRNIDGTAYRGIALVVDRGHGHYEFLWRIGAVHTGVGKLDGNTMLVYVGNEHPAVYQIEPDGSLAGTWANGQASERMTPVGELRT